MLHHASSSTSSIFKSPTFWFRDLPLEGENREGGSLNSSLFEGVESSLALSVFSIFSLPSEVDYREDSEEPKSSASGMSQGSNILLRKTSSQLKREIHMFAT